MTTNVSVSYHQIRQLESAADQLRDMRVNVRTIYEAIDTKIDVERLIRRVIKDIKAETVPAV